MSRPVCLAADCGELAHARGLCGTHYAAQRRSGNVGSQATCGEPDCTRPNQAQGVCHNHYIAGLRSGEIVKGACREYGCIKPRVKFYLCGDHQPGPRVCVVPNCTKALAYSHRTFCLGHHARNRKYGLGPEEMAALDAGVDCKLCGEPAQAVDHCHATGVVRGFLCSQCNMGLGSFKDQIETMWNAMQYLTRDDATRIADIQNQLGLVA